MYMYKKSWMRIRHLFVDWPCIWCEATEVQRPSWNQDLAHQVLDSCEVTDPTNGPRLGGFPSLGPPPPRKLTKTWVPSLGDLWSQKPQVRKSVIVGILSSLSLFFFRFSLFALPVDAPPVAGCSFLKLSFSFPRVSGSQNGSTFVWEGRGKNKTSGAMSDCLSAARLFLRPEKPEKVKTYKLTFSCEIIPVSFHCMDGCLWAETRSDAWQIQDECKRRSIFRAQTLRVLEYQWHSSSNLSRRICNDVRCCSLPFLCGALYVHCHQMPDGVMGKRAGGAAVSNRTGKAMKKQTLCFWAEAGDASKCWIPEYLKSSQHAAHVDVGSMSGILECHVFLFARCVLVWRLWNVAT